MLRADSVALVHRVGQDTQRQRQHLLIRKRVLPCKSVAQSELLRLVFSTTYLNVKHVQQTQNIAHDQGDLKQQYNAENKGWYDCLLPNNNPLPAMHSHHPPQTCYSMHTPWMTRSTIVATSLPRLAKVLASSIYTWSVPACISIP